MAPAVDEHEPDLVIVDLQMGSMGGMAVCLELRLEESYGNLPHVPVLMLLDRRPDVFLAKRSGAEGWIVKPLDPIRLRKATTALIEGGDLPRRVVSAGARPGRGQRCTGHTPPVPAADRSLRDVFRRREDSPEDRPPGSRPGRGRRREEAGEDQERLILAALHDLRDTTVREVMTPRVDVVGLPIPVHAADVARAVRQTGHSSFPVYDDDLDHLIGILFVNDLFRSGWELDGRNGTGNGGDAANGGR